MYKYITKKIFILFFLLIAADSLLFFIVRVTPGNPAVILAGNKTNSENIIQIEEQLNINKPILDQYSEYINDSVNFNFGKSFVYKESVSKIIFKFFPNTIYLSLVSMFLSILISFPLGILSSLKPDSRIDIITTVISSTFLAIPNFLLGPLLILLFSVSFNILPVSGTGDLKHIILPALTLGLSMTAFLTIIVRSTFNVEMKKPYVLLVKAKGLSNSKIIFKHILKNAMMPILTVMGLQFGSLVSGVIITETIFSWQGIGILLINGIRFRDYPLIQGITLLTLFIYLTIHFIVDVSYLFLNPKLRIKEAKH